MENEKEITINGKAYVLKEEVVKSKKNEGVMDPSNVFMLLELTSDNFVDLDEQLIKLQNPELSFKKLCDWDSDNVLFKMDRFLIFDGNKKISKYSTFPMIAFDKIIQALYIFSGARRSKDGKKERIDSVYVGWDEAKKEVKKDYPCILRYSNYAVLIAPRVEKE